MPKKILLDLKNLASKPLSHASAMPKEIYTSEKILDLEDALIFSKEWICAGRETEIPKVGDYVTFNIGKQPIIILRGANKKVMAMSNVCLHRMMQIVEGKGNKKVFTCPYHCSEM